jgi:hypothetical protein
MGLDTYRALFEGDDFAQGMAVVADETDSHNRVASIAAAALAVIDRLEGAEGPVSARDVYWNIRKEEGFETVTTDAFPCCARLGSVTEPSGPPLRKRPGCEDWRISSTRRRRVAPDWLLHSAWHVPPGFGKANGVSGFQLF